MKLRCLTTVGSGHGTFKSGEIIHVPEADGLALIESKSAELVAPRSTLPVRVSLIADIHVEHAPMSELPSQSKALLPVYPQPGPAFGQPTIYRTPQSQRIGGDRV